MTLDFLKGNYGKKLSISILRKLNHKIRHNRRMVQDLMLKFSKHFIYTFRKTMFHIMHICRSKSQILACHASGHEVLTICLSVSFYLPFLSVSFCMSFFVSLFLSIFVSPSLSLCLSFSLFLYVFHLSVSVCQSLFLLSVCFSLCVSVLDLV